MSDLTNAFKACAFQAGKVCSVPNGRLIREFGLGDFLENAVQDGDDAATIAVLALKFFCEDEDPQSVKCMVAVLAVGDFLNRHHARRKDAVSQQSLKDLVALLRQHADEQQLRDWIDSHFG